jgi:signal transduction histidine kinase
VKHRRIHALAQFRPLLQRALDKRIEVPLLVLRCAGRTVERTSLAAFARAAERIVRDGDALAHEPGSDWFAVALLAPARRGGRALSLDGRSALERIAATLSLATGTRVETGWYPLASADDLDAFTSTIERALDRGARERERYEFLATVGHELRTPLTSIRGYVETLLDDELDAATARHFLEVVRNEALRLGRLVDGMLDFSPLDLSVAPLPGATDMGAAAEAAVEALAPIAREAKIGVAIEREDGALARIGADACMHVLLNVIENAIKYGGPDGRVRVTVERVDPFIRTVVDDDGPGVAAEEYERIFERRARGGGSGCRSGSGIGLAIVRAIVERAAGTVRVDRSPLGGARFVISLPRAAAESGPRAS